jgi:hypothetical protein
VRCGLFPSDVDVGAYFVPRLLPAIDAVVAVRKRPDGQNRKRLPAGRASSAANPDPVVLCVVRLLAPQPVTDDGSVAADGAQSRQQLQRDRRRTGIGLAFGLGQCDKKNHGWREGLPLITTLRGYEFVGRPSPSRQINPNEKRLLLSDASRVVLYGLAGIKGLGDNFGIRCCESGVRLPRDGKPLVNPILARASRFAESLLGSSPTNAQSWLSPGKRSL